MEQPPKNESQNPRERFDELENEKERVRERIKRQYGRMGGSTGSALGRLGRRQQMINGKMDEIKGEAQEEAIELNEKYRELVEKATKALTELRDFEANELGMNDSNAIEEDSEKA